jgi:hypothetical protein
MRMNKAESEKEAPIYISVLNLSEARWQLSRRQLPSGPKISSPASPLR